MTMTLTHDIELDKKVDLQLADDANKVRKITIKTAELLKAVKRAASIVNHNHANLVLRNIFFAITNNEVILRAENDSYSVETTIDPAHCVIEDDPRSVLFPAKRFLDIISKMSGKNTTIFIRDSHIRIKSGRANMDIGIQDSDEFPALPKIKKGNTFEIAADALLDMYSRTVFATSKLQSMPVLQGVLHDIEDQRFRCVATDRHRFAQVYHPTAIECEPMRVSVPAITINEVMKHLKEKKSDTIKVTVKDTRVIYDMNDTVLYSQVLEGTYPDTNRIIPTGAKASVTVPNSEFLGAVKRAAIFLDDSGSSKITLMIDGEKNQMRIQSLDSDEGTMLEDMTTLKGEGEFATSTMNGRYLLESLNKISGTAHVEIKITTGLPFLLRETNALEGNVNVVVPVKHRLDSSTGIENFMPDYSDGEGDPFADRADGYAEQASEDTESQEGAA
ncbi:DNA polymerase III subunit beta [Paenibacillus sp. TCA20]|uniref:DNA polymerase III subunit beta n=1 Tax=Paenibacillus sp. TCA20 TaxID=1499968 RepID=UPI0004D86725|nr:DNA polymerase III subunit beta [Paenibacillus sp. TCA20]GAK41913.1 DNA polymerase III subunit beta [Paenibacillus sp. TCA20]